MDQINKYLISIKVQTKISKYFGIMSRELCFLKLQLLNIGSIRMNILMLDTRNVEQTKDVRMYTCGI